MKNPSCWRDLRQCLRKLGAEPVRTRGSHEMWRFPGGDMFVVVRNHLDEQVPKNILARFRRLKAARESQEPGSIPSLSDSWWVGTVWS
ncbi:MAG: type II toxin-antitoxin system HicA family toxin [Polyangiaceae bacterium]